MPAHGANYKSKKCHCTGGDSKLASFPGGVHGVKTSGSKFCYVENSLAKPPTAMSRPETAHNFLVIRYTDF
ncbi:hypothetical protein HUJ05_000658 [Dendroctonus ponderosae]|nr:hypothetical protein HUJ05_000658 [Dendroctonus ponderosae]